jgi:hypothetical protein
VQHDPLTGAGRYRHGRINHSAKIYVSGGSIEGFFGLVKTGVRGAQHVRLGQWLQGY